MKRGVNVLDTKLPPSIYQCPKGSLRAWFSALYFVGRKHINDVKLYLSLHFALVWDWSFLGILLVHRRCLLILLIIITCYIICQLLGCFCFEIELLLKIPLFHSGSLLTFDLLGLVAHHHLAFHGYLISRALLRCISPMKKQIYGSNLRYLLVINKFFSLSRNASSLITQLENAI